MDKIIRVGIVVAIITLTGVIVDKVVDNVRTTEQNVDKTEVVFEDNFDYDYEKSETMQTQTIDYKSSNKLMVLSNEYCTVDLVQQTQKMDVYYVLNNRNHRYSIMIVYKGQHNDSIAFFPN